jgi:putative tricarboxylic transport membrane protein
MFHGRRKGRYRDLEFPGISRRVKELSEPESDPDLSWLAYILLLYGRRIRNMTDESRKRDLYLGIGFLLFSLGVWIASFSIKHLVVARIGSAFVPQLAATLLGILSIVLILQSVLHASSDSSKTVSSTGEESREQETEAALKRRKRVRLTFLLILFYLILLEPIGFLITTALYLFFQFWVLTRRKPNLPLYGIIAVSTSVIIYYLFVKVFVLFLPAGILG